MCGPVQTAPPRPIPSRDKTTGLEGNINWAPAVALTTFHAAEPPMSYPWNGAFYSGPWEVPSRKENKKQTRKNLVNPHALWTHKGLRESPSPGHQ